MVKIKGLRNYNFGVLETKGNMYVVSEGETIDFPDSEPYTEALSIAIDGGFVKLADEPKSLFSKKPKKEEKKPEKKKVSDKE